MANEQTSPSWRLEDAAKIAKANPYTFYKPSAHAITLLQPGNLVKLIFQFESTDLSSPRAERMWVKINRIEGDAYFGSLDNDPRYIKDLVAGSVIEFGAQHIIQVDIDDPVPDSTAAYWPRCFVTSSVLKDGCRVGYFYRETGDKEDDSGWRFTAGDESDEYMDDPANLSYVSLGAVLSNDDSFVALLQTDPPCAFVLDTETGTFKRIETPPDE